MLKAASLLAFALSATILGPSALAQKDRAGLLAAWEQEQKSDPNTTKFEKISDGQYNFATTRFPFDGRLIVRDVWIDTSPVTFNGNHIAMGTVETELQGLPDDFHEIHAVSYAQWYATNTLYWVGKSNRWLTSREYFQGLRDNLSFGGSLWSLWPLTGWTLTLLAILAFVMFNAWRANRRVAAISKRNERVVQLSEKNSQLVERNAQLQEENNKIIREMLEELKKLSAPRQ